MKKYILKVTLAAVLVCGIVGTVGFISYRTYKNSSCKIAGNKHVLIIGNSHTQYAIDDNIFSSAKNISESGEHYFFSYFKAKKMLSRNPHIDTLILPISEDIVTSKIDDRWATGEALVFHLKQTVFYMEPNDIPTEILKSTDFLIGLIRAPLNLAHLMVKNRNKNFLMEGGYIEFHQNAARKDMGKSPQTAIDTCSMQFAYLKKIIALCDSGNVELVLINTPKYRNKISPHDKKFDSLRKAIIPNVKYMDYSAFPLPDSCYADMVHLNSNGARIFSEYLQKNGLTPIE